MCVQLTPCGRASCASDSPGLSAVGSTGQGGLQLLNRGLHIGWAMVSGRIAGRNVARASERSDLGVAAGVAVEWNADHRRYCATVWRLPPGVRARPLETAPAGKYGHWLAVTSPCADVSL
jgi:hypothetical protein